MSTKTRNDLLGAITVVVATTSFACAAYVAVTGSFDPLILLLAVLAQLSLAVVIVGLAGAQRPGFPVLGQAGAVTFALGCLLAAFVLLYALVAEYSGPAELRDHFGGLVRGGQAFLVPGGLAFGVATYLGGRLPRWSAGLFVLGMLLLIPTLDAPAGFGLAVEGMRDLGLVGMGLALLPTPHLRLHLRHVAPGT